MLRNSGCEYQMLQSCKTQQATAQPKVLASEIAIQRVAVHSQSTDECATQKLHSAPGLTSVILSLRKHADVGEKHDREPGVDEQFLVELCRTGSPNVPKQQAQSPLSTTAKDAAAIRVSLSCSLFMHSTNSP
eukprot:11285-Heterococcus_DN1.PRE.2